MSLFEIGPTDVVVETAFHFRTFSSAEFSARSRLSIPLQLFLGWLDYRHH